MNTWCLNLNDENWGSIELSISNLRVSESVSQWVSEWAISRSRDASASKNTLYIYMRHFDETLWLDIVMRHCEKTFLWHILIKNFDGIWRTLMTCNDLWWPLIWWWDGLMTVSLSSSFFLFSVFSSSSFSVSPGFFPFHFVFFPFLQVYSSNLTPGVWHWLPWPFLMIYSLF